VNSLDTPYFYRDLIDIVVRAGDQLDLVIVPKVARPADVYVVDTLLTQIERDRGFGNRIGLEVQIESAEGLLNCATIAAASPRLEAIVFGPGDYAATIGMPLVAIGMTDEWDAAYGGDRLHYARHQILVAGRVAGLRVIDGPYADFRDEGGLRSASLATRALGFDGKWCIHPAQIGIVNEIFSPTATEIAWSRRVVDAYAAAERDGRGAIELDGKMIDMASIRMARSTLARVKLADPMP
jgi:citrate lyase subunit beta/citryl-CoA lyase